MERSVAGRIAKVRERPLEGGSRGLDVEGGHVTAHTEMEDEVDKNIEAKAAGDEGQVDCAIKGSWGASVNPTAGAQYVAGCGEGTA